MFCFLLNFSTSEPGFSTATITFVKERDKCRHPARTSRAGFGLPAPRPRRAEISAAPKSRRFFSAENVLLHAFLFATHSDSYICGHWLAWPPACTSPCSRCFALQFTIPP